MAQGQTILICVGATKAGTSWLRAYLGAHPQVSMRQVKELHYFDTVELGTAWGAKGLRKEIVAERAKLAKLPAAPVAPRKRLERGIADREDLLALLATGRIDPAAYLAYLAGRAGVQTRAVGDVTPAYALLSETTLAQMAEMAPDVRFLFLMRDPVARLWSHVRMAAMRTAGRAPEAVGAKAHQILREIVQTPGAQPQITARGDYPAIVAKLKRAVPAAQLKLAFTEEAITHDGVVDLCAFFGLETHAADTTRRVHEGVSVKLGAAERAEARAYLAPHYEFVEREFGRLPAAWQTNQAEN